MLSDKERIAALEKKTAELFAAKEKIERQSEIKKGIETFINEQEKGVFKYAKDVFKVSVILAIFYTGGTKALEIPWIHALLK